uniref:Diacylglycerol kinase n=1 Tax=Lynceus sp. MCZ IZ 141354 TaxID=1930659 RepID=A0A9N6WSH4_9CRUS|nr:EOG090X00MP [Lynceus sp. MCZ IZ 141354]
MIRRPPRSTRSEFYSPTIKSGNSEAVNVLSEARKYLNPIQIIDVADIEPAKGLLICKLLPDSDYRLLIAGGDGTISWVFSSLQSLKLNPMPLSAVVPLGTGNDLSRELGWGTYFNGNFEFSKWVEDIYSTHVAQLDRWKVDIQPVRHLGFRLPIKSLSINNYFSIGVDALVALNFHRTRQSSLYFPSRIFNKLIYLVYGTKDILDQNCDGLEKQLSVYLDDKVLDLPELQALVVLNIDSWGAGVHPWSMGVGGVNAPEARFDDGLLEVIGVTSSFHIGQMQLGLSEPFRFGQAKRVKIEMLGNAPVQADGEPWEQGPCQIDICSNGQVPVLVKYE